LCLAILVPVAGEYSPAAGETVIKEIKPPQKTRGVQPPPRKKRNQRPEPPRKDDRKEADKKQVRNDKPEEKPTLFKDLKVGETFYFPTDAEHKYFPYVKLSPTSAKSVVTPANPTATIIPMAGESPVVTEEKK
jgi:hypothetical protein